MIRDSYIDIGEDTVYSFHFLDVLRQLERIIYRHRKCKFLEDEPIFKRLKIKSIRARTLLNEVLSINESFMLHILAMSLFEDFPHRLRHYIQENKLSHWRLTRDMGCVPFWYERIVSDIAPRYVPYSMMITQEEIACAKEYLVQHGKVVNKANLTRLLGANFFSSYSDLGSTY